MAPYASTDIRNRSEQGFSLTELLVTMIILLLVSLIVAAGTPTAVQTYKATVDTANAQVLLSTASIRLRDELSVADPSPNARVAIHCDAATGDVTFMSLESGFQTTITCEDLMVTRVNESASLFDGTSASIEATPLIPTTSLPKGAQADMQVRCDSFAYDAATGVFTVSNLQVVRPVAGAEGEGEAYQVVGQATLPTLCIRAWAFSDAG